MIQATRQGSNIIKHVNVNLLEDKSKDLETAIAQQYKPFGLFAT